ncbi:hypothetical protein C797_10653 [Bacillus thuringiensis Sbt003]|uniref:Uncharacterized protein n=1 Tax=Bacillus thuringiensis Sbt003 TaxID=1235825 RepID=A0A9X0F9W9_BACTU|nr:hypothetical protein C797_10653 [Bacillus thuringiensis Sbt003]
MVFRCHYILVLEGFITQKNRLEHGGKDAGYVEILQKFIEHHTLGGK